MSNLFGKSFIHVLKEAPADELDPATATDAEAMQSTLDPSTNPNDFSVDQQAAHDHTIAISKMQQKMIAELQTWVNKLEEFGDFLNGTGDNSMQSKLKNALPDTIFEKIRTAEAKKIARVAMEVAALNEMMKSYLAQSGNSGLRGV